MITLVDYGIGNLRSLQKAIEHVGVPVLRTGDPQLISEAERIVVPGVGAFGACASALSRYELASVLRDRAAAGTPLLGVCVGMQLLFDLSLEHGEHAGLGFLPGRVERLDPSRRGPASEPLKVPHMGWNQVTSQRAHPVADAIDGAYVYFVHSYAALPSHPSDLIAIADYGGSVAAVVGRNNLLGVQFHPEKSHDAGLTFLRAFADWSPDSPTA